MDTPGSTPGSSRAATCPSTFTPRSRSTGRRSRGHCGRRWTARGATFDPEDGFVFVGRNVRHALKNEGGAQAHGLSRVVPGGRLQEFLTEAALAAQDGLYNAHNLPTSWRGAIWNAKFAYRFRDETVMCSPPPALQRIVLPPIARLAS